MLEPRFVRAIGDVEVLLPPRAKREVGMFRAQSFQERAFFVGEELFVRRARQCGAGVLHEVVAVGRDLAEETARRFSGGGGRADDESERRCE